MEKSPLINKTYSVVILAAGHSSRMGKPKLSLPFNDNQYFIEALLAPYKKLACQNMVIVVNPEGKKWMESGIPNILNNSKIVVNTHKDSTRFYSIQLGLKETYNTSYVFVHNIDNPFITSETLALLWKHRTEAQVVSPSYNGKGGHPLLLSPTVVQDIISKKQTDYILSDYLKRYEHLKVSCKDPNILTNINTPEAYENLIGIKL